MYRFLISLRHIIVFIILLQISCDEPSQTEPARSVWHFKGQIGKYLDNIAEQRILDEEKWLIIYPETEEAFRLREDDKAYPQRGQ